MDFYLLYLRYLQIVMSNKKPNIPKGMRDFTSEVMFRRNYIFNIIKDSFERYGYAPIETPTMENISTLSGKYGDAGDRLIFKVLNSGDFLSKSKISESTTSQSLSKEISDKALRYDLTVPFARFVSQNRSDITFPFKRYQMQNVWRADKPQKGRYREFYQCDADVIGTESLLCEIELIQLCDDIFTNLKIPKINICINNRKILSGMVDIMGAKNLFDDIVITLDKLENIGLDKVKKELLSKGLEEDALNILEDFLNAKDVNDLSSLLLQSEVGKKGVDELKFVVDTVNKVSLQSANLVVDVSLARGLDYYTGCIFEVKSDGVSIGSLGGGGRYDDLTSIFGLKDISGVGISFGVDRIYLVMQESDLFPKNLELGTKVMFINFGDNEANYCLSLLKELRLNGISSELYPKTVKMSKQMNYANDKGVKYVVMVGEDEMKSGILTLKDMNSGVQDKLSPSELIKRLSNE